MHGKISLPNGVNIIEFDDKFRFVGNTKSLLKLVKELHRLSKYEEGQKCEVDRLIFIVSDYIPEGPLPRTWIQAPKRAWGIMASKFQDCLQADDTNPLDFNGIGYLDPKLPIDIGIHATDQPDREFEFDGFQITSRIVEISNVKK